LTTASGWYYFLCSLTKDIAAIKLVLTILIVKHAERQNLTWNVMGSDMIEQKFSRYISYIILA